MLIIISSCLTEVALPIVVGVEKHVLLSCLTDVAPVRPQYASASRFYLVRTWLLTFFNNTARLPSLSDRWRVRTCCARDSSAKYVTPRASWRSLAMACRWSRRARISHLSPLAFQVAKGRFDTTLRPQGHYAGEGKWLSMGVALRTFRAI